jgi:hypothetical protein
MNEFYGIVKLLDGTELVGNVLPCDEQDGFIVENPFEISVELIMTPAGEMYKVDMRPWIKFAKEDIFFVEKNKVFTVAEADNKILTLYRNTLKKYLSNENNNNRVSLDKELGFKNKIQEARDLLEKSFKLNLDSK